MAVCLVFRTDNASSNYSMTRELQSTLEASGIEWPTLRNHIPCMAHPNTAGFRCIHEQSQCKRPHQVLRSPWARSAFWREWSIDIGNSQRLRKEGNARINKVFTIRPGLAKIIGKERISWYFESPEAGLHIAENASCINYTNIWSPKRVYWLSKSQSPHCSTSDYGCEDTLELYTGVTQEHLPFTGIHTGVALIPKI